jgi:predicted anti-sigma-YlaC factor YlaD
VSFFPLSPTEIYFRFLLLLITSPLAIMKTIAVFVASLALASAFAPTQKAPMSSTKLQESLADRVSNSVIGCTCRIKKSVQLFLLEVTYLLPVICFSFKLPL